MIKCVLWSTCSLIPRPLPVLMLHETNGRAWDPKLRALYIILSVEGVIIVCGLAWQVRFFVVYGQWHPLDWYKGISSVLWIDTSYCDGLCPLSRLHALLYNTMFYYYVTCKRPCPPPTSILFTYLAMGACYFGFQTLPFLACTIRNWEWAVNVASPRVYLVVSISR